MKPAGARCVSAFSGLETGIAGIRRDLALLAETDAHMAARLDSQGDRLARIERRLDIVG